MATGLVFHCEACGARFEVDPALAGKRARCQGCGARTRIPAPRRAAAAAPAPVVPPPPRNWVEAVNSQVGLAPLSEAAVPAFRRGSAPSPLDDASSSALYRVVSAPSLPAVGPTGAPGRPAGALTLGYRRRLLGLQRGFRWLNENAYLVSVPFLVVLFLGLALRNRPLVYLAATVVVLLNLGRLVAGLGNLVVIPFRESPLKGLLFLLPPYTVYYLWANWARVRKPVMRIAEPALTLGLVVAAFGYVPFLAGGGAPPKADVRARLEAGAEGLRQGMESKLERLPGAGGDAAAARGRRPGRAATPSP
jgi:hypothetical protein